MRAMFAILCLALPSPAAALDRATLPSERPMEPCPAQGQGFFRVPGTATCVRMSGRVSAGYDVGSGPSVQSPTGGRFQIDSRSPSDVGEVRGVVRMGRGR